MARIRIRTGGEGGEGGAKNAFERPVLSEAMDVFGFFGFPMVFVMVLNRLLKAFGFLGFPEAACPRDLAVREARAAVPFDSGRRRGVPARTRGWRGESQIQ